MPAVAIGAYAAARLLAERKVRAEEDLRVGDTRHGFVESWLLVQEMVSVAIER